MNITIEYDPEEQMDADRVMLTLRGPELASAVWEYDQWLRSEVKHKGVESMQAARDELHNQLDAHGLNVDMFA